MSFRIGLPIYVKEEAGILIRTMFNILINLRNIAMFRIFRKPQSSWPHFSEIMKESQDRPEQKVRDTSGLSSLGEAIILERQWM